VFVELDLYDAIEATIDVGGAVVHFFAKATDLKKVRASRKTGPPGVETPSEFSIYDVLINLNAPLMYTALTPIPRC
jgi:hypothetical protein